MKKVNFLMMLSVSAFFMASTVFAAFDTSVNLIEDNPGFEDDGSGWNTGGGTIDDTQASEGVRSAKLTPDGSGARDWRSNGYFNVTPGEQYQFAFDYKTEVGATGKPQVRFRFFSAGGSFKGEGQRDLDLTNDTWQPIVIEQTCPEGTDYFDIMFSASKFGFFGGSVWFDNTAVNPWVSDDKARNPVPTDDELFVLVDQTLSWDKPFNDPNGYVLYIAEGADPNWNLVTPEWSTNDPNETSYEPTFDFDADKTYSWRVDTTVTGDVWEFTTIPPVAFAPDPVDGETEVSPLRTCSWGDVPGALSYEVYWGTDEALVTASNASVHQGTQLGTSIAPAMDFTTQYFWRIDTNLSSGLSVGNVWDYTTDVRICDPPMAGDTNDDCIVDMDDFANLASDWLRCTLANGLCP